MSLTIRFGTYNRGISVGDYLYMVKGNDQERQKLISLAEVRAGQQDLDQTQLNQAIQNIYLEVIVETAKRLANELDVIALQEIGSLEESSPFIKTLQDLGFTIHHVTPDPTRNMFSTAVAIRTSLFEQEDTTRSIRSQSFPDPNRLYGQDIAVIIAKVKGLSLPLAFCSLHSWGFQLYRPNKPNDQRSYLPKDNAQAGYAEKYTQEALDHLNNLNVSGSFIGGDMNNNLDNHGKPFNLIQEAGFELLTPDQDTNFNAFDNDYPLRKIDFLFASQSQQSIFQKLKLIISRLWSQPLIFVASAKVLKGFDFTHNTNCSDHKPVGTTILIATSLMAKTQLLARYVFKRDLTLVSK